MTTYKCKRTVIEKLSLKEMYNMLTTGITDHIELRMKWIGKVDLSLVGDTEYYGDTTEHMLNRLEAIVQGNSIEHLNHSNSDKVAYSNAVLFKASTTHLYVTSAKELSRIVKVLTAYNKHQLKQGFKEYDE